MQGRSRLEDVLVRIALFSQEMRTYGRIKKMKEEYVFEKRIKGLLLGWRRKIGRSVVR
jgi:hypothetical protein